MKSIKNMAFGLKKAKEVIKSSLARGARLWVVVFIAMISSNVWATGSITVSPSSKTITTNESTAYGYVTFSFSSSGVEADPSKYKYLNVYMEDYTDDDKYWYDCGFGTTAEEVGDGYYTSSNTSGTVGFYYEIYEAGTYTATMILWGYETDSYTEVERSVTITLEVGTSSLTSYTVNFNAGSGNTLVAGSSGISGDGTQNGSITTASMSVLPTATPCSAASELGWIFDGWHEGVVANNSSSYNNKITTPYNPSSNTTLNAVYKKPGDSFSSSTTFVKQTGTMPTSGHVILTQVQTGNSAISNSINGSHVAPIGQNEVTFSTNMSTENANCVWEVSSPASGQYTFQNFVTGKYLGTNASGNGVLLDEVTNYAKWTIARTSNNGFFLTNVGKNAGLAEGYSAYLRYSSGSGWKTVDATSDNGTTDHIYVWLYSSDLNTTGDKYQSALTCSNVFHVYYSAGCNMSEITSGSVPYDNNLYNEGDPVAVAENDLVRTGYTFNSWLNSYNGYTFAGDGTATIYMGDVDITLTAQWDAIPCTARTLSFANATVEKTFGAAAGKYQNYTLSAGSGTVTWDSSDKSVATVNSDGTVTILSAGNTTISVNIAEDGTYCEKNASYTLRVAAATPTVTNFTESHTNNTITIANANASTVSNKGGALITSYGYLYSTSVATPTYGASGVNDVNVGTDNIALNTRFAAKDITELAGGTTYYVRAYAYNGTAYGYSDVVTVTTKCAVTYLPNGGTGTTVDASSPYAKLSNVTVLANGFTAPSGKKFKDWLGSDDNHYDPSDVISSISGDFTLTAQWDDIQYKDYVFACVNISVASASVGKALITSRSGVNVMATNPIKVTVSGAVAGHNVTFSNTAGLHFYKKVAGTGEDAGKYKYVENAFTTPMTAEEVYVSYNPGSTGNGAITSPTFTISVDGEESQEFNTSGEYVRVRNLPETVAIVAKTATSYSALPANMSDQQNPKPVMVSVTDVNGVLHASGPSTLSYKVWPVKTTNGSADHFGTGTFLATPLGDRLRFAGVETHGLWATSAAGKHTIKNDAQIDPANSHDPENAQYEWIVTTTESDGQFIYTMQIDPSLNTNLLRLWGSKWGTYEAGKGNEELYIMPLDAAAYTDITVMEWGTNEIAVSYPDRSLCSAMTAKIGTNDATTVTITSLGGDMYKLTNVGDLSGNAAKTLTLTATESGSPKQAIALIPYIISSGTGTPTTMRAATGDNTSNTITRSVEVVVLSGAKFEVDGSTKLMTSDMYIHPGGTFEIASGRSISMTGLYLHGGYSWLGGDFGMPYAKINASIDGIATGNGLNYDYYIDEKKYYDLAVPKSMIWDPVAEDNGNDGFTLWVKWYNGATRATTGKGWTWYDWSEGAKPWNINMGQGYVMAAQPSITGRPYIIVRFPLNMTLPTEETTKDPIEVHAYGMTGGKLDDGVTANNAGWNFIANPFLTKYKRANSDGVDNTGAAIEGSIKTGTLVKHPDAEHWDGSYDWEESSSVRYVTTYNYETQEYRQHAMSSTTLEPFTGFFIQVAKDCYIRFDQSERQNKVAIRRSMYLPDDMEVGVTISGNAHSDETIILLCDELSRANALEFPDESSKIINNGVVNLYTFAGTNTMYANGMTYAEGQEWNKAGVIAPVAGEYTFSLTKVQSDYVKAVLLKDKNSNTEYDLMYGDTKLYLEQGTIDDRFEIKIVMKSESEVTTDVGSNYEAPEEAEKFIYHDKLFIRTNGVIFDATGKKVK